MQPLLQIFSRNDSLRRHNTISCPASKSLKGGSSVKMTCVKKDGDKYPSYKENVKFSSSSDNPHSIYRLVIGSSVETPSQKNLLN